MARLVLVCVLALAIQWLVATPGLAKGKEGAAHRRGGAAAEHRSERAQERSNAQWSEGATRALERSDAVRSEGSKTPDVGAPAPKKARKAGGRGKPDAAPEPEEPGTADPGDAGTE